MRTLVIIIFIHSAIALFGQSEYEDSPIVTLRVAYGKVNSFMGNNGESYFDICGPPCKYDGYYYKAVPTNNVNCSIMFHLNRKNSLGIGVAATQHGNRLVLTESGEPSLYLDYLFEYYGFNIRYQHDFLFSKRLKLGIANAIEFEYLSKLEFGAKDLHPLGRSWASELIFGLSITKHIELDISFLHKIALEDYGPGTWSGEFRRTGSGMLLGFSYSY